MKLISRFWKPSITTPVLILTCSQLDGGARKRSFDLSRFLQYSFIEGPTATELQMLDPLGILQNPFNSGFGPHQWPLADAAVAYGHYRLWQKVLEFKEPVLIMEDDTLLHPLANIDHLHYLKHRNQYPTPSVLTLWRHGITVRSPFNRHYNQAQTSYGNSGALGYLLDQKSAEYLLEHFSKITSPLDHYLFGMGLGKQYSVFVTRYNLVRHKVTKSLRENQ